MGTSDGMWACVLHGKEDVRLERVPVPVPRPGEALLQVEAALTCGTDAKVFRRGYHSRMIQPPAVFGHEFAGRVIRSENARLPVGTRVVAANSAPCGECRFCRSDRPNLCRDLLFVNGAYAEYLCLPERIVEKNCLVLPPGLSPIAAALVEPLACAIKGVADVAVEPGEAVLVIGAGPLGLLLARTAVLAGASVTVLDAQEERLRIASELGVLRTVAGLVSPEFVDEVRREYTADGLGFDCVIEAVGRSETWHAAVELLRPGGRVNLFGGCPNGTELRLDATRLHYEELRLCATFHHTPAAVRRALTLIADGSVPAFALIRQGRSLHDLPELLEELSRGAAPPKTAVLPQLAPGSRLDAARLEAFARDMVRAPTA